MHYTQQYAGGFKDSPDTSTPVIAAFLNAVESALLGLLGAEPTDGEVQVYDNALGRFKTILLTNAHIDPAAAIDKTKLGPLSIVNDDIAAGAAIDGSKIAGNFPISKLADYPGSVAELLRGDGSWGQMPGQVLGAQRNASDVSTSGTSFGAGVNVLTSAIAFTADGTSSYLVRVNGVALSNSSANEAVVLTLSLDGAASDDLIHVVGTSVGSSSYPCSGAALVTPSAASHTVNVRLWTGGGTAKLSGPIVVTVEKAS